MASRIKTLSGSEINHFCFGIMQGGGKAKHAATQSLYQMCSEVGINYFDTAYAYCEGTSEKFLGAFCDKDRDALLIATKVDYVGDASKTNILAQFDQCQTRLKMDVIDLLYLHQSDPETSLEETLETFAELKQRGKIHYFGISNFSALQGMDTVHRARVSGLNIDFFQPIYNVMKRQAEVEILPMCEANGITVATYSPLCGGLLTGQYLRGERGRLVEDSRYTFPYEPSFMRASAKKLCDLADSLRKDPATLALALVHAHPTQPMPFISASCIDQLVPSIEAMTYAVSEELYNQISNLSPTPQPATDRIDEV